MAVGEVDVTISRFTQSPRALSFTMHVEGNLPLKDLLLAKPVASVVDKAFAAISAKKRRPQFAPDIDTMIDFQATFTACSIEFKGVLRGDGFPNAEVFVIDARGNAVPLFDYRTKAGLLKKLADSVHETTGLLSDADVDGVEGPLLRLWDFSPFAPKEENVLGSFTSRVPLDSECHFQLPLEGITPTVAEEE